MPAPDMRALPKALGYCVLATAVLCGALVMVVEVIGARVVGPFYGVSLFVWTSLITVTLLALALGYAAGGRLADRGSRSDRRGIPRACDTLYALVVAAGILIALIGLARAPVMTATAPLGLRLGALAASLVLFGPALVCLGCVTPIVVRLLAADGGRLGATVGGLYAWSTLGSLAGTLATGFVLLALFPVDRILALGGALLVLTGAAYFAAVRRRFAPLALIAVPLASFVPGPAAVRATLTDGTLATIVAASESFYGSVRIVEYAASGRRTREMLIDGLVQGGIDTASGLSIYETTWLLELLPVAVHPHGRRALAIGLGPGLVANAYAARDVAVEVVEIDPRVVAAARRHFGFPADIPVHVADARQFLAQTAARYDYLLLDAFTGDTTPAHLLSVEALRLARSRLNDGGVLAINLMASLRDETFMSASVLATVRAVFGAVELRPAFDPRAGDGVGNVILLAYDGPRRDIDRSVLTAATVHPLAREGVARAFASAFEFAGSTRAIVLTDGYNPLDVLDVRLKERVRRRLLEDTPHRILLGGGIPKAGKRVSPNLAMRHPNS